VRSHRGIAIVAVAAALLSGCASNKTTDDANAVRLHLYEELDSRWQTFSGTELRPIASEYHFILPGGVGYAIVNCMKRAGYSNYEVNRETSMYDVNLSGSHTALEALTYYGCYHEYVGYDPSFGVPDEATRATLYEYYVRQLVPCLEAASFSIPSLPSAAQFNSPAHGQPGGWNPYLQITTPESEYLATILMQRCPAYPR
jgi:hypothetical protein